MHTIICALFIFHIIPNACYAMSKEKQDRQSLLDKEKQVSIKFRQHEKKKREASQTSQKTLNDAKNALEDILPNDLLGMISDYSQGYYDEQNIISKPTARYPHHQRNNGAITSLILLPSQCVLSGSHDKTIKEFDPATGKIERIYFAHDWINCLAAIPGGFLSGGYDKTVKEWSDSRKFSHEDRGGLKHSYRHHKQAVSCLAVLGNGHFLSGSRDGSIIEWDLKTKDLIRSYRVNGQIVSLIPLSNGKFVSVEDDTTRTEWGSATGNKKNSHKIGVKFLTTLKSGNLVAAKGLEIIEIDKTTGQSIKTYGAHESEITCLELLPSGNIISGSRDNTLIEWDTKNGKEVRKYIDQTQKSPVLCLLLLPSGVILTGSEDGIVRVWDPNPKSAVEQVLKQKTSVQSQNNQ